MGIAGADACPKVGRLSLPGEWPIPAFDWASGEPTIDEGDVKVRSSINMLSVSGVAVVLGRLSESTSLPLGELSPADALRVAACFAFAALKTPLWCQRMKSSKHAPTCTAGFRLLVYSSWCTHTPQGGFSYWGSSYRSLRNVIAIILHVKFSIRSAFGSEPRCLL